MSSTATLIDHLLIPEGVDLDYRLLPPVCWFLS